MIFQNLIVWSKENYSHFPWRVHRTLYHTLVSEVMLQQTTMESVIPKFITFINRFKTVEDLAAATEEEVLMLWKGLGYYRRARSLHACAKEISSKYHGEIPLDYESLIKLKGVGEYTANAILSMGGNLPCLTIDANLERVLGRFFQLEVVSKKDLARKISELFFKHYPNIFKKISSRELNEAFMDLGRVVCRSKVADCEHCPLASQCASRKNPLLYPLIQKKELKERVEIVLYRFLVLNKGKILGKKREKGQWLEGQLEMPTLMLQSEKVPLMQYPLLPIESLQEFEVEFSYKTTITKYSITNRVVLISKKELETITSLKNYSYFPFDKEESLWSSATLKALKGIYK